LAGKSRRLAPQAALPSPAHRKVLPEEAVKAQKTQHTPNRFFITCVILDSRENEGHYRLPQAREGRKKSACSFSPLFLPVTSTP